MSGPALCRYFASRDELLTELVLGYIELAAALKAAIDSAPNRTPRRRFEALAKRLWGMGAEMNSIV